MTTASELIRAYNLFRGISAWPELLPAMRASFLGLLIERGIVTRESLAAEVRARLASDGVPNTEENRREYESALIDLLFATHLSPEEAREHANLVRKYDKCQELARVAGSNRSSRQDIHRALKEFCDIPKGELFISPEEAEGIRVSLLSTFISNQLPYVGIAKKHVTIRDMDTVLDHTIGAMDYAGRLGGKSAGMILAQKILLPLLTHPDPELESHVRLPDTWYVSSGVFSEFIDRNGLYFFHTYKYRDREAIEAQYKSIEGLFASASFPEDVVAAFRSLMEEVGEHPIIVRSSSHLEDSFGLTFAGKYKSVFLANQGDLETRLAAFLRGVKSVLASMYGPDPILYRRDHSLLDYNEQMAMIVQKVVGRRFGDWFLPFASGVMFSYNSYAWDPRIRKSDGLVQMVFGLGTRATDRMGGGYSRMIPLSHPLLRPEATAKEISRYSQKTVDAINLRRGGIRSVDFATLAVEVDHPDLIDAVSIEEDGELATPVSRVQDFRSSRLCLTFENLLTKTPFVPLVKKVLATVQEAYGKPVDIEFAWDDGKLYILQCRSLSTLREIERVKVPVDAPASDRLFLTRSGLCSAVVSNIEYIVYVDPRAYDKLASASEKSRIGWAVGQLNKRLAGKVFGLLGPGRWGSNDINLGVPVSYADINATRLLVEIAFAREGATPEVSFGTHFFQDLVESNIAYVPLYPDSPSCKLDEEFLLRSRNVVGEMAPELAPLAGVVHVVHVPAVRAGMLLHVSLDGEGQVGAGVFGPAKT